MNDKERRGVEGAREAGERVDRHDELVAEYDKLDTVYKEIKAQQSIAIERAGGKYLMMTPWSTRRRLEAIAKMEEQAKRIESLMRQVIEQLLIVGGVIFG